MQFTQIPFPLKALKLLLHEVQHVEGGPKGGGQGLEDVVDDDGDDEWDDDDPLGEFGGDEFGFLSCAYSRLGSSGTKYRDKY